MTTIRDAFDEAVEVIATTFRDRISELEETVAALQKEIAEVDAKSQKTIEDLTKENEQLRQNQQNQQSHALPSPPPAVATIKQSEFVDLTNTHDTLHSQVEELEQRVQSEVKGTDPSSLVATLSHASSLIESTGGQGNVKELRTKEDVLVKLLTKAKSILFPMLEKANNLRDACEKQSQTISEALRGEGDMQVIQQGDEIEEVLSPPRTVGERWDALSPKVKDNVLVTMYVAAKKVDKCVVEQQTVLGGPSRRLEEGYKKLRKFRREIGKLGGNIICIVRARPLLGETASQKINFCYDEKHKDKVARENVTTKLGKTKREQKISQFDRVIGPSEGQDEVWEETKPLVESVIRGDNGCLLAYGETGSGKTYTMLGDRSSSINEGIASRVLNMLFDAKQEMESHSEDTEVTLTVGAVENYQLRKSKDLLTGTDGKTKAAPKKVAPKKTAPKKTAPKKVELIEVEPNNVGEALDLLEEAQRKRIVSKTNCNPNSSRSHLVFTMRFVVKEKGVVTREGKLQICDLAGSENFAVSGAPLAEVTFINRSLAALRGVIRVLRKGAGPVKLSVAIRQSMLTQMLEDSFTGNSKTLAIICCNPGANESQERATIESLDFAESLSQVQLEACATQNRATTAKKSKAGKKSEPGADRNGTVTQAMKQRGQSTKRKVKR